MRKYPFYLFIITSIVCTNVFADNKLYINSKDVIMAENGIFVKIENFVYRTTHIFNDDIGIYITDFETVKCQECERDYPAYLGECPYNGTPEHDNDREKDGNQ